MAGRADEIVRWYDKLKAGRDNFDYIWQQIIDHIDPHNADITYVRSRGQKKNEFQFDGTSAYGSHVFSQFVQGALFNQATQWFSLASRDTKKNAKPENAAWMNDTTSRMHLQLKPTFYGPAGQAVHSWGLFGNGPVLTEEVPREELRAAGAGISGRIKFTSVPAGQYVMAEGANGRINQFIRCLKLPAHKIVKMGEASSEIKSCAEKDPMREFEILHSIMPRDFQETYAKIRTARNFQFASCWIEKEKKKIIKESGYRKFPVAVARYDLIAGETYARGLGEIALPDQKTLNMADERAILKWGRELDPPLLVKRNSVIGGILSTQARGRTIVSDINNSVKALNENSNWPAHDSMADRKQRQLFQVWHVQEILNLLSREKPEMTAFEVNARLTLLQQIIGPIFGLLETEFLGVIIDIVLDIMAHIPDMLSKPPDDLRADSPEGAFDVVYEGPLARAQRMQVITNMQQGVADVAGIQPFFPQSVLLVDWEKMQRKLFEVRTLQEFLKTKEDFETAVELMQKQKEQEKMMNMLGGGAAALGAAAPGLKALREGAGEAAAA